MTRIAILALSASCHKSSNGKIAPRAQSGDAAALQEIARRLRQAYKVGRESLDK